MLELCWKLVIFITRVNTSSCCQLIESNWVGKGNGAPSLLWIVPLTSTCRYRHRKFIHALTRETSSHPFCYSPFIRLAVKAKALEGTVGNVLIFKRWQPFFILSCHPSRLSEEERFALLEKSQTHISTTFQMLTIPADRKSEPISWFSVLLSRKYLYGIYIVKYYTQYLYEEG